MSRSSFAYVTLLAAFFVSASSAAEKSERNPRVLLITEKNSPRCEAELARLNKSGGVFEAMRRQGWKIGPEPDNHVQLVDRDDVPEVMRELEPPEFPAVACIEGTEIVRSFRDGCTTPLDAWTFGFLLKGKSERPPGSVPEAARVKSTNSYPLRGNHWSVEGDARPTAQKIISHLRGPNHGHQIAANYVIESWSYEELRSLHDDLHEREIANGTAPAYSSFQSSGSASFQFRADRKVMGR